MYYEEQENSEEETGIVFRDTLFLVVCAALALLLIILPHMNTKAKKMEDDITPPGNVIVEIEWPKEINADVDLWVQAPGDVPVGYSNKGGRIFNLLRDDLGHQSDSLDLNYETSFSRGIPSGEYTVNVHLYRNLSGRLPIPVKVVVSVKKNKQESAQRLVATEVALRHQGEEVTAVRFTLRPDGELLPGSIHALYKPLRSAKNPSQ